MRKIAPAFILTTLVAFSSGSAFALGDANKNKKAPTVTPAASDATAPADKTYTAPTNPSISGAGTASDTGKGGATPTGSPPGATSSTTSSNASMANDTVAVGKSKPYSAKDCQGLAVTDPLYKSHNCGAMKGGAGSSSGEGGGAGAAGSSSSGSGR